MTTDNPYRTPAAPLRDSGSDRETGRPSSPLVLGILAMIFAGIGLLSIPFTILSAELMSETYERMGLSLTYVRFSQVVTAVTSVWLVITGIGLVKYKRWARTSFTIYALVTIVMTFVMGFYTISHMLVAEYANEAERVGAIGGSFASFTGLLYPLLGLFFLNQKRVKNALRQ